MFLGVDIGNTQIVLGLIDKSGNKLNSWRINTRVARTEDEYAVLTNTLLKFGDRNFSDISVVAISSVVPHITQNWINMCRKYLKAEIFEIKYHHLKNFGWNIDNPDEMGADRLCNIAAGFKKFGGPVIILEFGTAITFDVIDKEGNYLGGAITPGLETTMANLHAKAAKLPSVSLEFPDNVLGKNTIEHIQSGLMFGTAEMVDGMVRRIQDEIGVKAKVIATGGLAKQICSNTKSVDSIEEDLILEGLYYLYEQNN